MTTMDRLEVRLKGTRYMIRKRNNGGLITYEVSDYRGHLIEEEIGPEVEFADWVRDYVYELMTDG